MVLVTSCSPHASTISKVEEAKTTIYTKNHPSVFRAFFRLFGFTNFIGIQIIKLANTFLVKICKPNIRNTINNYIFANFHLVNALVFSAPPR